MADTKTKVTDVVKNGVDNISVATPFTQLENKEALKAVAKELGVKIEDGTQKLASKAIATKPSKEAKVSTINGLKIEER